MKLELYTFDGDINGEALRIFLTVNSLKFHEIKNASEEVIRRAVQGWWNGEKISFLRITKSHSISILRGFDEQQLNLNVLEHIKKYNIKLS